MERSDITCCPNLTPHLLSIKIVKNRFKDEYEKGAGLIRPVTYVVRLGLRKWRAH